MVKDPWWLFAYWEIQAGTERSARSQLLPHEVAGLQSILRVYDVTGVDYPAKPAHASFDIGLSGLATNWYIHTNAPGQSFIVELGLLTAQGRFLLLARSNRVTAPRFGPSDVIDEAWMISDEDFWKLFGEMRLGPGASGSASWSRLAAHSLSSVRSSGNLLIQSPTPAVRGFWCRVDTDLVIHGATEPRATVTIQGQPVAIRKDGTFSLRLALPAGTQSIAVECTSSDGRQTRTVTPLVSLAWPAGMPQRKASAHAQQQQPNEPSGSRGGS
jgi:hypothetical protein